MAFIDIAPTAPEFYDDAPEFFDGIFGDPPEALDAQEAAQLLADDIAALRLHYHTGE